MMAERDARARGRRGSLQASPRGPREQYRGFSKTCRSIVCLVFVYDTVEYKAERSDAKKLSDTIKSARGGGVSEALGARSSPRGSRGISGRREDDLR